MQTQALLLILLRFLVVAVIAMKPTTGIAQENRAVVTERNASDDLPVDVYSKEYLDEQVYADDTDDTDIEVIVIRGSASGNELDSGTNDSMASFDSADLAALGAQNIADLAAFTPNLEIVTAGATTPTFFIRGVGLNDFNTNSSSAVAIVVNDVTMNSPALQLGTLFDIEAVTILRGPQGSGNYRSASAGAIKIYTRKPTGIYNGNLNGSFGNYGAVDLDGAVGGPVFEDILAVRFAFRFSDREGYGRNGCGNKPPRSERMVRERGSFVPHGRDPVISQCGEFVSKVGDINNDGFIPSDGISRVPAGLPTRVNNQHNWAVRGTLLFQPTLDQEWLFTATGSKRDELTRLGQSIGTAKETFSVLGPLGASGRGVLGGPDRIVGGEYTPAEITRRRFELDPCIDSSSPVFPTSGINTCFLTNAAGQLVDRNGNPTTEGVSDKDKLLFTDRVSRQLLATELARNLDSKPYHGDYNRVGSTRNETWGLSLKGDVVLANAVHLTTVSSFDHYDRFIDNDADQSPNQRFESISRDNGWQFFQSLNFEADVSEDISFKWILGGLFLYEELNAKANGIFDDVAALVAVSEREYQQTLWSGTIHAGFSYDFLERFVLDGGVRYNWDRKTMQYSRTQRGSLLNQYRERVWQAPTGSVRLTYNFKETTYAYWKYTRGWKGGHFNATSGDSGVTFANPENIDSFEIGLNGGWFDQRVNINASLFHYNYESYQLFTSETKFRVPPQFVVINASNAEVYGAEVSLVLRPTNEMSLQVRASWLESQFLDYTQIQVEIRPLSFSGNIVQNNEIQNSGNPLLNSPQFKISLTAEQAVPLGRLGTLTARWDGAWTAATTYDATNSRGIPNFAGEQFLPKHTIGQRSFWIHNMRIAYQVPSRSVEIAAWVRNVENFVHKTYAFDASTFQDITIFFLAEPRTFGLSITTSF